MRVRDQDQIDLGQVFDFAPSPLEALHEENPIPKVGIDQQIQVGELTKKRSVPDPGDCDLALDQRRKVRAMAMSAAGGEPPLPDHFVKERARIEMLAGGEFFERSRNAPFASLSSRSVLRVHRKYLQPPEFAPDAE